MRPTRRAVPSVTLTLAFLLSAASSVAAAEPVPDEPAPAGAAALVRQDYTRFYSTRRLIRLAAAFAAGGALANSDGDEQAREWYLDEVRPAGESDAFGETVKAIGEGEVVMPVFVVAAFAAGLGPRGPEPGAPATWLRRSARAYLVGAPALYYLQQITGGARPGEPEGSGWEPFHGNHGVSGHAFVGAVPFLTLARQSPRPAVKVLAVTASTLTSIERLREDQHFLSQVLLGWFLAWEATGAIAESDRPAVRPAVAPLAARGGGGLLLVWRF